MQKITVTDNTSLRKPSKNIREWEQSTSLEGGIHL